MQTNSSTLLREDRSLLAITHLTQLLTLMTGFGGLIVPLVLWLTQRDTVLNMDEHGRAIVNFQISMIIYCVLSVPLILLFGLGILTLIFVGIAGFVLPIVNAIRASNGDAPYYPLTIKFV